MRYEKTAASCEALLQVAAAVIAFVMDRVNMNSRNCHPENEWRRPCGRCSMMAPIRHLRAFQTLAGGCGCVALRACRPRGICPAT